MGIIGGSGLVLWFPVFFSRLLPGSWFNIALLVHGEEALLAVGFIFTVHFFNGHLRPDKFPMDPVIFTGRGPPTSSKEERPGRVRTAVADGLRSRRSPPGAPPGGRSGEAGDRDDRRHAGARARLADDLRLLSRFRSAEAGSHDQGPEDLAADGCARSFFSTATR